MRIVKILLVASCILVPTASSPAFSQAVENPVDSISVNALMAAFKYTNTYNDNYYVFSLFNDLAEAFSEIGLKNEYHMVVDSALNRSNLVEKEYFRATTLLNIAGSMIKIGDYNRAIEILQTAQKFIGPNNKGQVSWLAREYAQLGSFAIAESLAVYGTRDAFNEIIRQYLNRGELDSAMAVFARDNPGLEPQQLYAFKFDAYSTLGQKNECIAYADSVKKYYPEKYYQINVAEILDSLGEHNKALIIVDSVESKLDDQSLKNDLVYYNLAVNGLSHYFNTHGNKSKVSEILELGLSQTYKDTLLAYELNHLIEYANFYGDIGDTVIASSILDHALVVRDSIMKHADRNMGTGYFDNNTIDIIDCFINLGMLDRARSLAESSLDDQFFHGDSNRRSNELSKICENFALNGEYSKALNLALDSNSGYVQVETIIAVIRHQFETGQKLTEEQKNLISLIENELNKQ